MLSSKEVIATQISHALGGVMFAWCLMTAESSALAQASTDLNLVSPTGRQSIAIVHSPQDQREMVRFADLVRIFDLDIQDKSRPDTITINHDGQLMILTSDQPVVSVAGRLVSLRTSPPRRSGDDWLVPLEFLSLALGPLVRETIVVRQRSRLVLIGDVVVPRISARYRAHGVNAQLDFEVRPTTPYTVTREHGRLILQFDADAIDVGQLPSPRGNVVAGINVDPSSDRLIINLGPAFGSFDVANRSIRNGEQVSLTLTATNRLAATPNHPAAAVDTTAGDGPLPDLQIAPALRVVAIDAGHGGTDEGAVSGGDTREKDVTLSVARLLRDAIVQRLGLRVILTRARDESIGLDERAATANNNKADLFISLHANTSVRPSATGAEVFYLSMGDEYGKEAREFAERNTQVVPVIGGDTRSIGLVQWELAQVRYLDRSAKLADMVHQELSRRIPMSPRDVQEAPFRVLVGANMPAVFVEMGFVSNPQDEQRLTSARFQNSVVEALIGSILRYRDYVQSTAAAAVIASGSDSIGDTLSLQARDE